MEDFTQDANGVNTDLPENFPTSADGAAVVKDTRDWLHPETGEVLSKSAFIRYQFEHGNKSRKQISEEFDIPYRVVYGATVNMENEAEPTARGRSAVNSKINVTAEGQVVIDIDGIVYVNGVATEVAPETTPADRNEWVEQQLTAGVSRGDLAKFLGVAYGTIYSLTKDNESAGRVKHMVTLEDGTEISRGDYIRAKIAEGVKKSDLAKELGVEYSVIWQATKVVKTAGEKFVELIQSLETYATKVNDPATLQACIDALSKLDIVEVVAAEEVAAPAQA